MTAANADGRPSFAGSDHISDALYPAYWAAIQLDQHPEALELATLMVTHGAAEDGIALLDSVALMTQRDLAGTSALSHTPATGLTREPGRPSHAASLRNLDAGEDQEALEFLRPILGQPPTVPSRSALDALLLLVRSLTGDRVTLSEVEAPLHRSLLLWEDRPSSFITFAAVLAFSTHADPTSAEAWVSRLGQPMDEFGFLAHAMAAQLRGDHTEGLRLAESAIEHAQLPRFELVGFALGAASQVALGRTEAARSTLTRGWRRYQAEGLLRFALRFAPLHTLQALADEQLDSDLGAVLAASTGDHHRVTWEPRPRLTRSETEVLALLQLGLSNNEIAAQRHVVVGTLRNQLKQLYRKLGVNSRAAAIQAANQLNQGKR